MFREKIERYFPPEAEIGGQPTLYRSLAAAREQNPRWI